MQSKSPLAYLVPETTFSATSREASYIIPRPAQSFNHHRTQVHSPFKSYQIATTNHTRQKMSSSGSNGRDHGGSGGSLSGWDQILSQASAIGIVYQNSPVRALCCPIFQVSNSQDDHSPDTRLTHCFGQPKEGTSSFSSSRTNRSDSNRYGHSSAKFKGGR